MKIERFLMAIPLVLGGAAIVMVCLLVAFLVWLVL